MIQWGIYSSSWSNAWITISMSQSFRDKSYIIHVTGLANDGASKAAISAASGNGSKIKNVSSFQFGSDGAYAQTSWLAIGTYS